MKIVITVILVLIAIIVTLAALLYVFVQNLKQKKKELSFGIREEKIRCVIERIFQK